MDWHSYPVLDGQVAYRVVDGSAVIVLAYSGEVQVLNPVGTRIWELIDGTRNVREIVEHITAEYSVSVEQAGQDVESFIQELLQARAIQLADAPSARQA